MPRLKKPLTDEYVQAADDEFYNRHPEMVIDGHRKPIDDDPDQGSLRDEWIHLYIKFGGETEEDFEPRPPSEHFTFTVTWAPDEKINRFREGPKRGKPITAVKAHVYFASATRLLVEDRWPLAEYYVYIDTDLSDNIDFEPLGLLWTDEKGFPHFCDANGEPTERVGFFPFAYSTDKDKAGACVLIYDTNLKRLKKKRDALQGTNGANSPHRVEDLVLTGSGTGQYGISDILVPIDNEVLPYDDVVALVKECDGLLVKARQARDALQHFMQSSPEHAVMWMHRDAINGWLKEGNRRDYLTRVDGHRITWDVACETFDREFKKLTTAYEKALQPLWDKVSDEEVRRKIFLCDFVEEGWNDPKGYHGLWCVHFFIETIGMFAGTLKHKEVFDQFVQPLLKGFSANWGELRRNCKCETCSEIEQVADPLAPNHAEKHFGALNLKLKDGKIITSTVQRLVDLATKFLANFGLIIAMKEDFDAKDVSTIGFLGGNIFKRGNGVRWGFFKAFASGWAKHVEEIAKRNKEFQEHLKELEDARKALFQKHLKMDPGKLGNAAGMLGGAIAVIYFFTKEGRGTKDWVDLSKGATDIAKGGLGLGKDALAKKFAEKYGEEAAKKFAGRIGSAAKVFGIAGAALQLGSAYLSLSEAADKGDKQAFVWGAVQYMGADIYLTGVAVEFTPVLGVSQAAGVVVSVVGAVVYVTGQIGEFVTRPGAEEKFLRAYYYYDDNDHRSPEEKEAEWQRRRLEQINRNWDKR